MGFARVGLKYLGPDIMWKEGTATIRQTIKGRPPVHLEQIISCLICAAAMQLCGLEYGLDDQLGDVEGYAILLVLRLIYTFITHFSRFTLDLPRWRHFVESENDKLAYDEITAAVWGVFPTPIISPKVPPRPLDQSYIDSFRTLVSNLVMGIGSLNLSAGSEANDNQTLTFPTRRITESPCPGVDRGLGHSPPVVKGKRKKEAVSNSIQPSSNEGAHQITRVTLLMAGVIFGVILAFMLSKHDSIALENTKIVLICLVTQSLFRNQVPEDIFSGQDWQDIKRIPGIAWKCTTIVARNLRLLTLCMALNTSLPLQCGFTSEAHPTDNEGCPASFDSTFNHDAPANPNASDTILPIEDISQSAVSDSRPLFLSVPAIDMNSPSSTTLSNNYAATFSPFTISPNTIAAENQNHCNDCGRDFSSRGNLNKHRNKYHPPSGLQQRFICEHCSKSYNEQWYLKQHMKERCKKLRRRG
jgi:hypothetical protein